ncbi:cyanophycin synthetase family protein, partial [Zavarzinella formosa]
MPTGLDIEFVLALRGPNIWARFPVLEVWVQLHDLKNLASSEMPGFNERLRAMLPSLISHRCSVGEVGGFFQRLERGTYMAHIFEHIALELQALAGSDVGFGKTRMARAGGAYKIGLEYEDEETGRAACELAKAVCDSAVNGTPVDLSGGIERLKAIRSRNRPASAVAELLDAAKEADVPAQLIDPAAGLVRLGTGARQRLVMGGQTDRTSAVGAHVSKDRQWTREWLAEAGLPVPAGGREVWSV